jgi:hypothetical protein
MSNDPLVVAVWRCTNGSCTQYGMDKYAQDARFAAVVCGTCGEPCTRAETSQP